MTAAAAADALFKNSLEKKERKRKGRKVKEREAEYGRCGGIQDGGSLVRKYSNVYE